MSRLDNLSDSPIPPGRRISLLIISSLLIIDLIWVPLSALSFKLSNLAVLVVLAGLLLMAGPLQRRFEFSTAVTSVATEIFILLLFSVVGFIFSYLVTAGGWAIQDELLVSIDKTMGFDWRAYTSFFLQNGWLRAASLFFYVLTPLLVGFTLIWFCLSGRINRASEFIAMFILGGVICVGVSGVLPSAGGAGYFSPDSSFYHGYDIIFDGSNKQTFYNLRSGAGYQVSLLHPDGLIAFPSYHACMALLVVLAFRGNGAIAWVMLVINLATLLVLPVEGGHHLSDVFGGLLVGIIAYAVVRRSGNSFSPA